MIFRRTEKFHKDFEKLSVDQKELVKNSFKDVAKALCGDVELYNKFKIKAMKKYDGIWEGHLQINFVFTISFEYDENEKICYFRRIGTHKIYESP